jgi:hypothetical protein
MNDYRKIICCDFDGTMVTHAYPNIGKDIGSSIWLRKLNKLGIRIILWTMRSDNVENKQFYLSEAVNWCTANNIELFGINRNPEQTWTTSPKAYAHKYIDDAAYGIPLIYPWKERPYVDWGIVGPDLMEWASLDHDSHMLKELEDIKHAKQIND